MTKHPLDCEGSSQYRGTNISQEIAFFNRGGFPLYASNRSFWKLWPPSQPRVEDHPKPRPRAFNRAKGKAGKRNKVGIRIFFKPFLDNHICFRYIYRYHLSSGIFWEINMTSVSATTTPGPLLTQTPGSRLLLTPTCNDQIEQLDKSDSESWLC